MTEQPISSIPAEQLEQIPTLTSTGVLRNAAGLIETRGHCKKALAKEDGSLCLIGALKVAAGYGPNGPRIDKDDHTFWKAYRRVQRQIHTPQVAGWNDARHRTKGQVIKALRKA